MDQLPTQGAAPLNRSGSRSSAHEDIWTKLGGGIRPVTRGGVIRDAFAGFQLAAMNIPQALGYTKIAGTPLVTGFYTLLLPLLAFAVFGSSRYLVVSADSATAAILAGGLRDMAPLGTARYVALAGLVALLTAVLLLLARVLQLGFLADFLSQTVLVGFLTGVGFQVGIAVLGEMLGLEIRSRRTIGQLLEVFRGLSQVHLLTVLISATVVVIVVGLRSVAPKVPGALLAVIGAITVSAEWDLRGRGVAVVGPVAGGLPQFSLPPLTWHDIIAVFPLAGSCLVMIIAQSAATARFYADRHHQQLDEDADLIGLSAANAAAAFSGTFVVNGSPTQTALVESSGGQSQLAQVATAAMVALVLLFLTKPLQYLPHCVLGAIVFVIALQLVKLRSLGDIRRESPGEYALALLTAAIVVLIGVEEGIVIAMVLSLLRVVKHSYHPQTGVLTVDEQGAWHLKPALPGTVTRPGVAIYRFGAALFYANVGRLSEEIRELAGDGLSSRLRWLVIDAEAIPNIDYTAAHVVRDLQAQLKTSGVRLALARVATSLESDLARHRLLDVIGSESIFPSLHDALAACETFRNLPKGANAQGG
ncbi:MAG TPA: SulP family inorganic anion transporter [Terriglobales bacterium]|nr:SulP family inorganic anion transporter [Terriglobales bacterium]